MFRWSGIPRKFIYMTKAVGLLIRSVYDTGSDTLTITFVPVTHLAESEVRIYFLCRIQIRPVQPNMASIDCL